MEITEEILNQISLLPEKEQAEILSLVRELEASKTRVSAHDNFLPFVKYMWPDFIEGPHHRIISELFDDVLAGRKKRVIVNMAPRHTKSEFASIYLPAYFLGRFPNKKIIQASHTSELAVNFGRKVRNIISREDYQQLFRGVALSADSKAAGRWATNKGGEYHAIGVEGNIAGKGADLFVIDDPHSEQDAVNGANNPEVWNKVMDWYEGGPRQRLQPGGAIIVVMTRWSLRDLTGQLIKKQMADERGDKWEVINLPAILPADPDKKKPERPIWPQFWSIDELNKTKASIPVSKWNAQYQQNPTAEEGALIKREWWMDWEKKELPKSDVIIQSWDTAFSAGTRADYSACTTWGVFYNSELDRNNIILLDAQRGKWEFPELKKKALEFYGKWKPDICLIEGRAAGQPLIYELRAMNIPIQEFTVGRGTELNRNTKVSRVNAITDIFHSKNVWAQKINSDAQEVIEECAAFPAGEHDDFVDTVVMALSRFREGGWIDNDDDFKDEDEDKINRWEYY